jgi:hypothetical protein
MPSQLDIAPEGSSPGGGGGGGPEGGGGSRGFVQRTEGLLSLAFGLALGVALIALVWLLREYAPANGAPDIVTRYDYWQVFIVGLIGGTIISAIYNFLVVRRLNLFGLESSAD